MRRRVGVSLCLIAATCLVTAAAGGQVRSQGAVEIPKNATALEGLPQIKIETTPDGAMRHELNAAEAAQSRLVIKIADGHLYWAGREGGPLHVTRSGDFTYLSWTEPGQYVRFRKLGDRLIYAEHVDMPLGSVTYWGELRIVLGK